MKSGQKLVLARRPGVTLARDDTALVDMDIPDVPDGMFLVEISHVALEVSMLGWMREGRSYLPNISIGDTIRAAAVGRVSKSRHSGFAQGAMVTGLLGAQTHALTDGSGVVELDDAAASAEEWTGALGLTTAFTAHIGLSFAPRDLSGKNVLVSGASGLVGSAVAQFARLRGGRVIGVAGGAENCRNATADLGLDACIDYRDGPISKHLHSLCPDRIDVFFDNAGGAVFDDTLGWMNAFGTVIMCGQTAERGLAQPATVTTIRNVIMERLTLRGFVVLDHPELYPSAAAEIAETTTKNALKQVHANVGYDGGLAAFHDAYDALVNSNTRGKHVLRLN